MTMRALPYDREVIELIETPAMLQFENTYATQLEGLYEPWQGAQVPAPKLVAFNRALAVELGLDADELSGPEGAALFAGSRSPAGATPLAQAYAGHQFGGFSPRLGDGRALLVGELIDTHGARRDLHLKGSGRTPFARGGDGKAVLGPVLREYLIGEAMHALGIPTTRGLAAVTTGEMIMREGPEPGAVLARIASSHLRVGTFQFAAARGQSAAARGQPELLRRLADYAIARHYPELEGSAEPYLGLLRGVLERQASLVAKWMSVGFVHGVMNTDNMTISGETIDYGPCAFIDGFDPQAVFSSIDHGGRYAYVNQPSIVQWNLARFAESLLPLIDASDPDNAVRLAVAELDRVPAVHLESWLRELRPKLGLAQAEADDAELIDELLNLMAPERVDFTTLFRELARAVEGDLAPARALFTEVAGFDAWSRRWLARGDSEGRDPAARAAAMNRVNPLYIPRNHKVEEALQSASVALNFEPFEALLRVLLDPYTARAGLEGYAGPAPADFGPYQTYCGT